MGRKQYDPALVLAGFFGTLLVLKLLLFAQNRPPKLEVMKSHLRTGKPTKLPWVSSFDQVEWETLTPDTSSSSVVERKALRSAGSTDGMTPLELLRIRGEGEYKMERGMHGETMLYVVEGAGSVEVNGIAYALGKNGVMYVTSEDDVLFKKSPEAKSFILFQQPPYHRMQALEGTPSVNL